MQTTAKDAHQDQTRFAEAIAASRRRLWRHALVLTRNAAAADDLVQDTLQRALASRNRFQFGGNLEGWLATIMRNLFVDGCRRPDRKLVALDPDLFPSSADEPRGPFDVLSLADVMDAISSLDGQDREIITLACVHRLRHRAISERLRIPVSTTGTRLFRVRRKLRRILRGTYEARLAALTGGSS